MGFKAARGICYRRRPCGGSGGANFLMRVACATLLWNVNRCAVIEWKNALLGLTEQCDEGRRSVVEFFATILPFTDDDVVVVVVVVVAVPPGCFFCYSGGCCRSN